MKYKFTAISFIIMSILIITSCTGKTKDSANDDNQVNSNTKVQVNRENNINKDDSDNITNTNLKEKNNEKDKIFNSQDVEDNAKGIIEDRAKEVLTAIKKNDMKAFSKSVHPAKGVRFSPYAYVREKEDKVFTADNIKNINSDTNEYVWGNYDGSGEPIKLNFPSYYKRFIYDVDFINAKEIGYNKALGKGNTINNSFQIYRDSIIVEYHFPGFDPNYDGADWKSLRLVFEKLNKTWYVVGIIHDQWTT